VRVGLFPGQGLDPGVVASALDEKDPTLRRANEVLGGDLKRTVDQVARRPGGVLPTTVAQPGIFTAGIMSFERAVAEGGRFDCLIGHSLGEYTALVAAQSISFVQGLELVAARASAMRRAAKTRPGKMAAIMNLSLTDIEQVCRQTGVTVANDNAPAQVVVSGSEDLLSWAAQVARAKGGRSVLLPVDGAYHSSAMEPAARDLALALDRTNIRSPKIEVISNVSAAPYRAPGEIRKLLSLQMTHRVRFSESVARICDEHVEFIDLGPGPVVGRLAEATARSLNRIDARV
jgi:malonyl CoA-acyl carrier protein transacylase